MQLFKIFQSEQTADTEDTSSLQCQSEVKDDDSTSESSSQHKVDGQVRIEVEGEEAPSENVEERVEGEGESITEPNDELSPEESNRLKSIEKRRLVQKKQKEAYALLTCLVLVYKNMRC